MLYVYRFTYIDDWRGWQRPADRFRVGPIPDDMDHPFMDASIWYGLWEEAQKLAKNIGWDGDVGTGPYFSVIPEASDVGTSSDLLIAWKQGNNGLTFVASPVRLEYLEKRSDDWTSSSGQGSRIWRVK